MNDKYLKLKYLIGNNEFTLEEKELKGRLCDICDDEERLTYKNISIKLVETNDKGDVNKEILWISGILFDDEYMFNNDIEPFNVYDSIDGDTYSLYDTFYENGQIKDKYYSILSSNIFYLDRIYVNHEYRNMGYATNVLNKLEDLLRYVLKLNVGLVVIYSKPFELDNGRIKNIEGNKFQKKLDSLYEKCGYINIEKTKYYYKKIE